MRSKLVSGEPLSACRLCGIVPRGTVCMNEKCSLFNLWLTENDWERLHGSVTDEPKIAELESRVAELERILAKT